jgi:hypothetical protein
MPQSIPKGLTREHVLKALTDLDAGIEHSFGKPTGYELVYEGKHYPPKAVVGIACRHLSGEILPPSDFSGGEQPGQANYELRKLGFQVIEKAQEEQEEGTGKPWSDDEVRLIVADYFDMLQLDLLGQAYKKSEHNERLREKLNGRSRPSVEFKHRNISAVLLSLGIPCIDGYKPAKNFQRSLVDGVTGYLDANPSLLAALTQVIDAVPELLPVAGTLGDIIEAPPEATLITGESFEPWQPRSGRKIDFVERDAANRKLGRLGEQFAYDLERRYLLERGRDDLAKKVEWVADSRGDGLGYDVLSFDADDDSERWIEVKTTALSKYSPFIVTANELRCSQARPRNYCLYRLFRFTQSPRLYVLHGSISAWCLLEPMAYRATVLGKQKVEGG